jgi:hypothetical protein
VDAPSHCSDEPRRTLTVVEPQQPGVQDPCDMGAGSGGEGTGGGNGAGRGEGASRGEDAG